MRVVRMIIAAAIVVAAVLVVPSPVSAKCQPNLADNGKSYWAGTSRNPPSGYYPGGVSAYILNYSPWVQTNSDVYAWTMLVGPNTGPTKQWENWAQVGWQEHAGGTRYTFVDWTDGQGHAHWDHLGSPLPVGSYTQYVTQYDGAYFYMSANGVSYPRQSAGWVPVEAEIEGEIHTLASQMPGGYSSGYHEFYNTAYVWFTSWVPFDGSGTYVQTYWSHYKVSSTSGYIYDNLCAQ